MEALRIMEHVRRLSADIGPRPLGSQANLAALDYVRGVLNRAGWHIDSLPCACPRWDGRAFLRRGGVAVPALANTWSPSCEVEADVIPVGTMDALKTADLAGRIALVHGSLIGGRGYGARRAFYVPDDQQAIADLLERKRPTAVLLAGLHPGCPERLIRDWLFPVPSATVLPDDAKALLSLPGPAGLRIESTSTPADFPSLVAAKPGGSYDRVVVMAHIDTQADTPGAMDNASGVAVLLALAERWAERDPGPTVELFVTNGEEVGGTGDAAWLTRNGSTMDGVVAAFNFDGLGQTLGTDTVAVLGGSAELEALVESARGGRADMIPVAPWFESDHAAFYYQGVPCVAFGSVAVDLVHMPGDTADWISGERLAAVADMAAAVVAGLAGKPAGWTRPAGG